MAIVNRAAVVAPNKLVGLNVLRLAVLEAALSRLNYKRAVCFTGAIFRSLYREANDLFVAGVQAPPFVGRCAIDLHLNTCIAFLARIPILD